MKTNTTSTPYIGACLDYKGQGVCVLGESGAGKTTHTYGLLRHPEVRVVSDDWFFVRSYGRDILAYSSEKNFYIRADLAKIWSEFSWLVEHAEFDGEGRAVVDLRLAIGKGRILPLTTLTKLIILKRDKTIRSWFESSQRPRRWQCLNATTTSIHIFS